MDLEPDGEHRWGGDGQGGAHVDRDEDDAPLGDIQAADDERGEPAEPGTPGSVVLGKVTGHG